MSFGLPRPAAVLFDVGDTLLEERRFDLEAGIAAVVDDVTLVDTLATAFRIRTADAHAHGAELLLARWLQERVPALAAQSVDDVENRIWSAVVTLVPRPDVAKVLARLDADAVAMAAISNAAFSGRILTAELHRHGLAPCFRFVLSSADVGARKPASAIFHRAIDELGVRADEAWFIGDTVDEDVAGALSVGLHPILFASGAASHLARLPPMVPVVQNWAEFLDVYSKKMTNPLS